MEQKKMLYCENCNAQIPEDAAKCPYCGALNALGGEKKYMEALFELKEDVGELKSRPLNAYKKELGRTGKIIRRTLTVVIIIAICFTALLFCARRSIYEQPDIEDVKAQLAWEKENFPKLNELYEAKDYDGILEFEVQNSEDGYYSISNWEHYDFINEYRRYASFKEDAAIIESGDYDKDNVYWCFIDAMSLKQDKSYADYTQEESEYIEEYRQETEDFLVKQFGMSKAEIEKLYAECCEEDKYGVYFSYKTAQKKIEAYIKNNLEIPAK